MNGARRSAYGRFRQKMVRVAYGNPLYSSLVLGGRTPTMLSVIPTDPWSGDAETGVGLINGIYHNAGQAIGFISARNGLIVPDWRPPTASPMWLRSLHGFDWLRDLRTVGGDAARRRARALVLSWLDNYGTWDELGWEPSVLGTRVANWIALHDFFCASADDDFRIRVFDSLARQTRHLARILPGRLDGAELLTAIRGLVFGCLCLPGRSRYLIDALRLLERELPRQIMADGGHIERNPSALLTVLRQLIDLRTALRTGRVEVPEVLQHAIDRMTPALRFFRHGDGGMALFNGGREEDPALIDSVLALADARGRPLKSAPHTGFERLIAGRTLVLMDTGVPPAPGADARSHAGTLSIEMSVGKERLIVNCGAHPGGIGAWHKALAATAAHSTLVMAETNSSEVLEDGGLGRRPTHVGCERQETEGAALVVGSHNGYAGAFGFLHRRRVYLTGNGEDLRGEDMIEPVLGAEPKPQPFVVRFHLHPSVQASPAVNGDCIELRLPGSLCWRLRASGGVLGIAESIYFGTGDEPQRASQVTITATAGHDGASIKWALRRERKPD